MKPIKAQPCLMGESTHRNNPETPEMALAFALHDYSQHLLRFSYPALRKTSPEAFYEWLKTIKQSIAFFEQREVE